MTRDEEWHEEKCEDGSSLWYRAGSLSRLHHWYVFVTSSNPMIWSYRIKWRDTKTGKSIEVVNGVFHSAENAKYYADGDLATLLDSFGAD